MFEKIFGSHLLLFLERQKLAMTKRIFSSREVFLLTFQYQNGSATKQDC